MRVLVTGGAGFIGRHVVKALLRAGHEVRVVDALVPEAHPTPPPPIPEGAEMLLGDLSVPAIAEEALDGVDAVSHHAAIVGRGREIQDSPRHVVCNDLATAVLLAAMERCGVARLVLASSAVIYGEGRYRCAQHDDVVPGPRAVADLDAGRFEPPCPVCGAALSWFAVTEDARPDPRNVYAATKLAQEHLCSAWARQTGGAVTALRYHNVYGADMPYESAYSGVASTFRSAVELGVAPKVFEDGGPRRDFIDVRDVAAANVTALTHGTPGFRTFNVASGDPHTILEMAVALAEAGNGPPPVVTGAYRLGDVRHIVASPARIMTEWGWRPRIDFATGMRDFSRAGMRGVPVTGGAR
jgi:dTDP-L-rhamnose 4-epimerase